MARIINICNEKGGVGKTTTAINLSAYLAALGKYVLLVDLDPQANTTGGLGVKMQDDHLSIYHSLVGDTSPGSYLRKTSIFGFDLLPASADLAGASVELVSLESREFRLKKALNSIRTHYDYILIDSPPSLGLLTMDDRRNRLARAVVREVQKHFPGRFFEAIIPRSISLAEAPSFGKTILQFDPDSKAGRDYRQLAEEVSRLVV